MRILSVEEKDSLSNELSQLLQKYDLQSGYLVANTPGSGYVIVLKTPYVGALINMLSEETHEALLEAAKGGKAPLIHHN